MKNEPLEIQVQFLVDIPHSWQARYEARPAAYEAALIAALCAAFDCPEQVVGLQITWAATGGLREINAPAVFSYAAPPPAMVGGVVFGALAGTAAVLAVLAGEGGHRFEVLPDAAKN